MSLRRVRLDELTIDDERSFRHVELYGELKSWLIAAGYEVLVPTPGETLSWDHALFLNLTFFTPDAPSDVLTSGVMPADVVAHAAWHHAAAVAFGPAATHAHEQLLAEAVASAFDLYLVGRLLGHAPDSAFLETQVPAMSEVAHAAGADEAWFESMLESVAADPEGAFEDLRTLLYECAVALLSVQGAEAADEVLQGWSNHRFYPLLHHYELSSWLLATRGKPGISEAEVNDSPARALHAALRSEEESSRAAPGDGGRALDRLARSWLRDSKLGSSRT